MIQRATILMVLVSCVVLTAVAGIGSGDRQVVPPSASPDTSASDAWGYTWVRSTDLGGPTFGWIDITGTGTLVTGLTDDNVAGPFPMSWSFPYYWYAVNNFTVGSNGYIAFGSQPSAFSAPFAALPNTSAPNNIVAPLVGDLVFSGQAGAAGSCYYWSNGTDSLIVSFINVTEWEQTIIPANTHTFQMILTKQSDTSGTIIFQYGRQAGTFNSTNNTRLCIGIENQTGQIGLNYTYSTAPPHALLPDSGLAIRVERTVNTGLQITDAGIVGVNDFENLGKIVNVNVPDTIKAIVRNFGTASLTNVRVTTAVTRALQPTFRDTVFIASLPPSSQSTVVFPHLFTPAVTGSFTVNVGTAVPGDQGPGNNSKVTELVSASFLPTANTRLAFDGGTSGGSINWIGGGGVGVAFDLPTYPVRIETVSVNVTSITNASMLVELIDDTTGGQPGRVLASRTVTAVVGDNLISFVSDSVVITGGRFFVGARGQIAFTYETAAPISNRSWEYTGGWAPYRSRDLQDVMIRATVRQLPPLQQGWNTQNSGITAQFYSVKAVSPYDAWAVATGGRVMRTTNAGVNWTNVGNSTIGANDIYSVEAVDANTAFLTTTPGPSFAVTYIFRTTNGGTSWDTVFAQSGGFIDAIKMLDANNGIAMGDPVGGKWTVLRTFDGGATWDRIATEPNAVGSEASSQNALCVLGNTHIWIGANAGGRIYRSTDGGVNWTSSTIPVASAIAVWFIDTQYGIASGSNGSGTYTAYRSTDGGASWSAVTVGTSGYNIAVASSGGLDFWMARGTSVFRSTDRGETWAQSYPAGTGTFYDLDFNTSGNSTTGWGVKDNGNIVAYYGNVSITGVGDQGDGLPTTFSLEQNYPNPFNPTTTLRYAVPTESFVTLTIYNILGQQVARVKDEIQGAGSYEVVWNGKNTLGAPVASGVYLYRLEGKTLQGGTSFSAVRKMVLMK